MFLIAAVKLPRGQQKNKVSLVAFHSSRVLAFAAPQKDDLKREWTEEGQEMKRKREFH